MVFIRRAAGRPQNAADEENGETANHNQFHKDGSLRGEVGSGGLSIPEKSCREGPSQVGNRVHGSRDELQ